ncbi:MAG: ATP-binding protein [Dactylosporangium sp.]|nr:ATP-binding protein [Dactylosporangium sp.]NNJ63023.1 ATP-binding protein [Dactylosporangium sp.]
MPTVRLSFSPAPAHVRTARLVGVATARRAGVAEDLLEEIRLAIGEACSRAVALHRSVGLSQLVDVVMTDDDRFTVHVTDHAAGTEARAADPKNPDDFLAESPPQAPRTPDLLAEEAVVARMGLALLAGLVDDLEVASVPGGVGTEVRMSWPLMRMKAPDDDQWSPNRAK